MSRPDVVLAGPSCAGKTSLAEMLQHVGFTLVTARGVIARSLGNHDLSRLAMQRRGAELEGNNPGRWLADAAATFARPVVLDAARTSAQIAAARERLPGCLVVFLIAAPAERERRYASRADPADIGGGFAQMEASRVEKVAQTLGEFADITVRTDGLAPDHVFDLVASRLEGVG